MSGTPRKWCRFLYCEGLRYHLSLFSRPWKCILKWAPRVMSTEAKLDLKATVNLPETSFPLKGNLAQNEPKRLQKWEELDLYARLKAARAGLSSFVLHDGPPYANGNIHIGTALNKTLKD